jgi:hypothetical protein
MLASTCGYAAYGTRITVLAGQCRALSCVGTRVPSCAVPSRIGLSILHVESLNLSLSLPLFWRQASDDDRYGSRSQVRWESVAGETYRI